MIKMDFNPFKMHFQRESNVSCYDLIEETLVSRDFLLSSQN